MKRLFYINTGITEEAGQQILSICIGERHFSFAITDKPGIQLHSLAYYTADVITTDLLSDTISGYSELNTSFYEVQVSYDYTRSILVPLPYFETESAKVLLNTMYGTNGQLSVISEAITEWQLYNIYAVPKDIHDWISRKYPTGKFRHYFTLTMKMMAAGPSDRFLINIHTDEFSFIAIKENKLLIAQTHLYSSPEDICYILLKTCHQFSLSQEKVQLSVSGLIEKESRLFREMYQFFINIKFWEPAWDIPATDGNRYPAHFFTTLNLLARCAS